MKPPGVQYPVVPVIESALRNKEVFRTEIIFEVTEDDVDGGYSASALGYGIHTQGDSVEEIRSTVKEAVCW